MKARCYNDQMLVERVRSTLITDCQIDFALPLLVGVSGGVDSLALLSMLVKMKAVVIVAHFNHQLRPDADDDEVFVKQAAQDYGLPFCRGSADVQSLALKQSISIETAARTARYSFLFAQAAKSGTQAVVTAHTADDQVETVLLHILRGSGLTGLVGMQPRTILKEFSTTTPLIRPLLETWRAELVEYCQEQQLMARVDVTNDNPAYLRNRIRTELLPYLTTYNPSIKQRLTVLSRNAKGALEILDEHVNVAYSKALTGEGEGYRQFDVNRLAEFSPALQMEIIRRAVAEIHPKQEDVDRPAFLRVLSLLDKRHPRARTELADGIIATRERSCLTIAFSDVGIINPEWPIAPVDPLVLPIPGQVSLQNGWVIRAEWADTDGDGKNLINGSDPNLALLDAEVLSSPLIIRRRTTGDRFQPFGMKQGSQSLGDFFTNHKLPAQARAGWPLVLAGSRIIWIPGHRVAEGMRVDKNSRRILRLHMVKAVN